MGHNKKAKRRNSLKTVAKNTSNDTAKQGETHVFKEDIKEAILVALREYDKEKNVHSDGSKKANASEKRKKGLLSTLGFIVRMPFSFRREIKGSETMRLMTSTVLSLVFNILRLFALLLVISSLISIGYLAQKEGFAWPFVIKSFVLLLLSIVSYLFAGIFRHVSVEVDNITDEGLLFAFFAAIGTWVSIIVALIALYK